MDNTKNNYSKIALMVVWLGKLPRHLAPWLISCAGNPTIDFLVVTDDRESKFDFPNNVKVIYTTFDEVKERIQKTIPCNASFKHAYKICDYKPAFGEIFADYLVGYDFWGHCDVDLIWGNLREVFTEERLAKYDRIMGSGPCSIYKNNPTVNAYYRTLPAKEGRLEWKKCFEADRTHAYDEWAAHEGGGLSYIMLDNDIPLLDVHEGETVTVIKGRLSLDTEKYQKVYYEYVDGHMYIKNKNGLSEDIPFLNYNNWRSHMKIDSKLTDHMYFVYPGILTSDEKALSRLYLSGKIANLVRWFF